MALSTKGLSAGSVTGNVPDPAEFVTGVSNVSATDCDTTTGDVCYVTVDGINLPDDCGSVNGYNGTGNAACAVSYFYDSTSQNAFRIAVKTHAEPRGVYVYAYEQQASAATTDEGLFFCTDGDYDADFGSIADVATFRADANCISQL